MIEKYIMTDETIIAKNGTILHRIKAVRDFGIVKEGELGGWIEKEENLSHCGYCWVFDNARVYGHSRISENARVIGNAWVFGNASIGDDACISDDARVCDCAAIFGHAWVCGDAEITGNASVGDDAYINDIIDCVSVGPIGSRDDYTTFYRNKNEGISVSCGCFNDTIEKFKKKVKSTYGKIGNPNRRYYKQYIASIKWAKRVMIK